MDRIKLQNILNVIIARLAIAACLTDKFSNALIVWWDFLETLANTMTRRAIAKELLNQEGLQLPESIQNLKSH